LGEAAIAAFELEIVLIGVGTFAVGADGWNVFHGTLMF